MKQLSLFIERLESAPLSLTSFVVTFASLVVGRFLVDWSLNSFDFLALPVIVYTGSQYFLEFLTLLFLLFFLARFLTNVPAQKIMNVLLVGFLFILFPPIIDTLLTGPGTSLPLYQFGTLQELFFRFFVFFGEQTTYGITWGIRCGVVATTLLLGLYVYAKTTSVPKSLVGAFGAYTASYIILSLPALLTILLQGFPTSFPSVSVQDEVSLFLTPLGLFHTPLAGYETTLHIKMNLLYGITVTFLSGLFLFREYPHIFYALLRNARFPQLFYHGGLLFVGVALALLFEQTPFPIDLFHLAALLLLLIAVECAWLASVVVNDFADTTIDALTNPNRPLITHTIDASTYRTLGFLFFFASLLFSALVHFALLLLLIAYQALAFLYSSPPLRLKRVPILATLIASLAGMLILFSGYMIAAPSHSPSSLPLPLLLFLLFAYMVALPIKDFKDIEGDRHDGVYTLPVLLGAHRAKLLIGSLVFTSYIISIFVLNIPSAFAAALFFGAASFFSITQSTEHHPLLSYRKLPGVLLLITTLYGFTLVIFLL